ncbi:DUF4209 domain-containing protein [Spirosoma gilvum]
MKKRNAFNIDFYQSLEQIDSVNIWRFQQTVKELKEIRQKDKADIICERKVFNLNFSDGKLVLHIQLTNTNGDVLSSLDFSNNELEYLENRLKSSSNIFLKARYSNVLWQETRNNNFAEIAINSYVDIINTGKEIELHDVPNIISAILYISKNSKRLIEASKKSALNCLYGSVVWIKGQILKIILDSSLFRMQELEPIANDLPNWIDTDNYFVNLQILETALALYKKIARDNSNIYLLLAGNEDIIIRQHPDDNDFINITSVGKKVQYLKKAKANNQYELAIKEYNRLKKIMKLNKISVDLDQGLLKKLNRYLKVKSDTILKLETDQILAFFAVEEKILLDNQQNIENSKLLLKASLRGLFSVALFDINNNFKKLTESEKLEHEILNNYTLGYNVQFYALFLRVFMDGVIIGKFNYYKVYNYFKNNTWYGQKYSVKMDIDDSEGSITWLSMIAPGIHNFFSQFELSVLLQTNKINNYILAIDSLTLKFEGVLRDFIRLTGGNTTVDKKGQLQEQLLEELIDNPKTLEYFSERDIALFKYAFIRTGLNIRNNVAHSFFRYSNYNLQTISLIFLCFLRLGKYELTLNSNK